MDSKFIPAQVEQKLYEFWEKNGYFNAKVDLNKKPFCIVLPPPNANGYLHMGHAMQQTYQDILIRYHKMQGDETMWVLGTDHAGIETQYVFEKELRKQGKSRFDFDRETLYKMIWDFVEQSKGNIKSQFKRLGLALDWSHEKYTLDPDIVKIVYRTFEQFFNEGLIYRSNRLVNFCTKDGTSFADLEVVDQNLDGTLYYIQYPLKKDPSRHIIVATTRPETLFGDVAVMVNPKDKRYKDLIGQTVLLPLTNREIPIIADEYVDIKFGTGAVKVTPAHDFNDFEVGKRHNLPSITVIGFDGKLCNTDVIDGLRVKAAREETIRRLTEAGLLHKTEPHEMVIKTCYKCGTVLEPLLLEQWYIKIRPLADTAIQLIEEEKIKIYPKKFKRIAIQILDNYIDWNISRQNVWGIRIPAYKCKSQDKWFAAADKPKVCKICGKDDFVQDTDIFDTWFSSGQWPFATLETMGKDFYTYFYPTSVMATGYDILRAWVTRMIMFGYKVTGEVPFENVLLHGLVRDKKGQKMSKSKGNVLNPMDMVDKYGADALRAALLFGGTEGNDVPFYEEKVVGMRNFANKIWNMGRFLELNSKSQKANITDSAKESIIKDLEKELKSVEKKYHSHIKKFQFSKALDLVYDFMWHRLADFYIEELKEELRNGNIKALESLQSAYFAGLKLLHPYMPFVTEAIWKVFHGEESSILNHSSTKI